MVLLGRVAAGLVFFLAGWNKVLGPMQVPTISTWLGVAVLPIEIAIGLGLLFFPLDQTFRFLGIALSTVYVVWGLVASFAGQTTCSCLGDNTPLWMSTGLASLVLVALLMRQASSEAAGRWAYLGVSSVAVFSIGLMEFANRTEASSRRLHVVNSNIELPAFGELATDGATANVDVILRIRNDSQDAAVLVGLEGSCLLSPYPVFPIHLDAGAEAHVPVRVKVASVARSFNYKIWTAGLRHFTGNISLSPAQDT